MLLASSVAAMAASSSYGQRVQEKDEDKSVQSTEMFLLLSNPERERLLQHVGGSRESGVGFGRTGSRRTLCLFGQIVRLAMPLPSLIVALEDLNQTSTLSPAPRRAYSKTIWNIVPKSKEHRWSCAESAGLSKHITNTS